MARRASVLSHLGAGYGRKGLCLPRSVGVVVSVQCRSLCGIARVHLRMTVAVIDGHLSLYEAIDRRNRLLVCVPMNVSVSSLLVMIHDENLRMVAT